ncbi:hypothetical protein ACFCXA_36795, partial [Streptomyces virginiae]|uniref:hypothetical protein n=1 Tax=Streptomyces virginiae TaxID=1961 RepID=UPI0035D68C1E
RLLRARGAARSHRRRARPPTDRRLETGTPAGLQAASPCPAPADESVDSPCIHTAGDPLCTGVNQRQAEGIRQ